MGEEIKIFPAPLSIVIIPEKMSNLLTLGTSFFLYLWLFIGFKPKKPWCVDHCLWFTLRYLPFFIIIIIILKEFISLYYCLCALSCSLRLSFVISMMKSVHLAFFPIYFYDNVTNLFMQSGWFNCSWWTLWQPHRNVWYKAGSCSWCQSWNWASLYYNGADSKRKEPGINDIQVHLYNYLYICFT